MTQAEVSKLLLPYNNFIAVGQSDIVNLDCVKRMTESGFEMINGNEVVIPRRLIKSVREAYTHYRFQKTIEEDFY